MTTDKFTLFFAPFNITEHFIPGCSYTMHHWKQSGVIRVYILYSIAGDVSRSGDIYLSSYLPRTNQRGDPQSVCRCPSVIILASALKSTAASPHRLFVPLHFPACYRRHLSMLEPVRVFVYRFRYKAKPFDGFGLPGEITRVWEVTQFFGVSNLNICYFLTHC